MADATKLAVIQPPPVSGTVPGGGTHTMWKVFDDEAVASTATVDSIISASVNGFRLDEYHFFGLWLKATSVTGTADVDVRIIQSFDDTAANYILINANGTVQASVSNEVANVYALKPAPMPFLRIRIVGVGANPADTIVEAHFWAQT